MSRWYTIRQFIRHRWSARRWDAFHSPILFRLFTFCCKKSEADEGFAAIEKVRSQWKRNAAIIHRNDYGAVRHPTDRASTQKINRIAHRALSLPFQCRFMARLARFSDAISILEFGTSLGIMAAYLKRGSPNSILTTIEGDPAVGSLASKTFNQLGMHDITAITSTFENFLTAKTDHPASYDLVFLDGNHRSTALLYYYDALKFYFSKKTIVVIDDIYWSPDMQQGWQQLLGRQEVTQSVDCFHFGMLFFNEDFLQKEHHRINLPLWV